MPTIFAHMWWSIIHIADDALQQWSSRSVIVVVIVVVIVIVIVVLYVCRYVAGRFYVDEVDVILLRDEARITLPRSFTCI